MFLRSTTRKKDGKDHRYFSVVENRRVSSGKTVQRMVVYLGEINDTQQAAWLKTLDVFDEQEQRSQTLSFFPDDREMPRSAVGSLQVKGERVGTEAGARVRRLLVGVRAVAETGPGGLLAGALAGGPRRGAVGESAAVAG